MKTLVTLIKREWWEYRGTFLYVPCIIGFIYLIAAAIGLLIISFSNIKITVITNFINTTSLPYIIYKVSFLMVVVMWLTIINYFWNCLFSDRKDGSVLFWQSMPIAQWQTLSSKLIMGLIVAPAITWICIVITQVLLFILAGVALSILGLPVITTLWHPGLIVLSWASLLATLWVQGLWLIPIVGWLMLCSAYAKKTPFLLAIIPPLVVIIFEAIFLRYQYFLSFIASRFGYMNTTWEYFLSLMTNYVYSNPSLQAGSASQKSFPSFGGIKFEPFLSPKFVLAFFVGLVIGFIFIAIAAILRNRCYDYEK